MVKFNKKKIIFKISIFVFIIVCAINIYIMKNDIGLIQGLNFGPGQYYYTDIPNWQRYFVYEHFHSNVSMILLIILFFIWGYAMYRLWSFLDRVIK